MVVFSVLLQADSQANQLWCVSPNFEQKIATKISINSYEDFQKLKEGNLVLEKSTDGPNYLSLKISELFKNSIPQKYLLPFKKFKVPAYIISDYSVGSDAEKNQQYYVVSEDKKNRCLYPLDTRNNLNDLVLLDKEHEQYFYSPVSEYDGPDYYFDLYFKYPNIFIKKNDVWRPNLAVVNIANNSRFEFGSERSQIGNPKSPIGTYNFNGQEYLFNYPGEGVFKAYHLNPPKLIENLQIFEKLNTPSFFYLHHCILNKLYGDDSATYGYAKDRKDFFDDRFLSEVSKLDRQWIQENLNQWKSINDGSQFTGHQYFYDPFADTIDYLLAYYDLIYDNGIVYLKAKAGYLESIRKIKNVLKDIPEITYPPEQELIEIYRLPGAKSKNPSGHGFFNFFKKSK